MVRARYPKTIIIPACFLTRSPSKQRGKETRLSKLLSRFYCKRPNQVPKDCFGPLLAKMRRDRQHLADGVLHGKAVLGRGPTHHSRNWLTQIVLLNRAATCAASLQSNGGTRNGNPGFVVTLCLVAFAISPHNLNAEQPAGYSAKLISPTLGQVLYAGQQSQGGVEEYASQGAVRGVV